MAGTFGGHRVNPVLEKWQRLYTKPSRAEVAFEPYVAKLGVPYRFQHIYWKYVLDFALPAQKVDIELDGPDHKRSDRQMKDAERTAWLKKQGWTVVRIQNDEVFDDPVGALNRAMERAGLPYRVQDC